MIFACAACGAISPRRYRSEPGASNKRQTRTAAATAQRSTPHATSYSPTSPCAPKAAGRSRIPLSTILRPVALGVPDVDNIAFLETLCSSFQAGETAARAEAHT